MLPVAASDAGFVTALPNIIDDAEQRLYRELDLLHTTARDYSLALTAGSRSFTLPVPSTGEFVVLTEVNVVTPAGTVNPDSGGTRNPLVPVSNEVINALWPSVTGSTVPVYFSMLDTDTIIVGPWPAAAYQVEVVGTIRPNALSSSVTTSILSVHFPDLLVAAGMVFATGYQKNFGSMVDDPKAAVSWEAHLQTLIRSAATEEARKIFTSEGWSSQTPATIATPPRT
jgi:hypothetical protein